MHVKMRIMCIYIGNVALVSDGRTVELNQTNAESDQLPIPGIVKNQKLSFLRCYRVSLLQVPVKNSTTHFIVV